MKCLSTPDLVLFFLILHFLWIRQAQRCNNRVLCVSVCLNFAAVILILFLGGSDMIEPNYFISFCAYSNLNFMSLVFLFFNFIIIFLLFAHLDFEEMSYKD